jgi:superfamily II DNA helicase RecQ
MFTFRGLTGTKLVPFRKWYGNLGELGPLFSNVNFVVRTATATISTREHFFNVLALTQANTFKIEISPDRENLQYIKQYSLSNLFG